MNIVFIPWYDHGMNAGKWEFRVGKIAISLPHVLLQKIERVRKASGLSRSAIIRRAIEDSFDREQHAALVARYVEAYRRSPETAREVAAAESAAAEALGQEPWK